MFNITLNVVWYSLFSKDNKMKIRCLVASLLLPLIFSPTVVNAVYIVDTGPGPNTINGHALGDIQWLASEFSLDKDYYITRIEGWLALEEGMGLPSNLGETFAIGIYGDGGEVPDTSNLLYINSATIVGNEAANWEGYDITWGNGLELNAGSYWVSFEQRSNNQYNGAMPFSSVSPLWNSAVNNTGAWVESDNLNFGVRIYGNPVSVPEPNVLALLGMGLVGLSFARKRKYR